MILEFVNGRLSAIMADYEVDAEPNGPPRQEFARVARLLVESYGLPSSRAVELLEGCTKREIGACIVEKQADFYMLWEFKDHLHHVRLSLTAKVGGRTALMLTYSTPESLKAAGNPGL
jgi:hypothetical protein